MRNRILRNEIDPDFLTHRILQEYHERALSALWRSARDHPALAHRIGATTRSTVERSTRISLAWSAIPIGESQDQTTSICNANDPHSVAVGNWNGRIVFSTSGTTGSPKMLINSYDEVIQNSLIHGKGYAACGITLKDSVVVLGEVGQFAAEFAVLHALSATGCTIIPIVDRTRIAENLAIMRRLKATVWLAMQSEMFPYLDALENECESPPAIRLVVTGVRP